tara:strand:- start:90 stop:575 length:486 start_codon:yes stop_codon:yes gene_type:complete
MATNIKTYGVQTARMLSGNMYFYKYSAEDKNEFYDSFPLIFMLSKESNIFTGINFHYLSINRRRELFDQIIKFMNTPTIESNSRILVRAYRKLILQSRSFILGKITLHKYKRSNIVSRITRISPEHWREAIEEPAERFLIPNGGIVSSPRVWRKTFQRIRD